MLSINDLRIFLPPPADVEVVLVPAAVFAEVAAAGVFVAVAVGVFVAVGVLAGVFFLLGGVGSTPTSEKAAAPFIERPLPLKNKNKAPSGNMDMTINLAVFFIIQTIKNSFPLEVNAFANRGSVLI